MPSSSLVPSASPYQQQNSQQHASSSSSTTTDNHPNQSQVHFANVHPFSPQQQADCWMDTLWAPPQLLSLNSSSADYYGTGGRQHQQELLSPNYFDSRQMLETPNSAKGNAEDGYKDNHWQQQQQQQQLASPMKLAHPGAPECQQRERHQMPSGQCHPPKGDLHKIQQQERQTGGCRLIVLKQPEEQHRARYASEGSRGAIKDRSGGSFCTIQLIGHYQPTRLELFAAQHIGDNCFVDHHLYRLIPVSGKSSTTTPSRTVTNAEGAERMEVMLRPENGMIVVLDCVGIMKICSYGSNNGGPKTGSRKAPARRRRQKQQRKSMGREEADGDDPEGSGPDLEGGPERGEADRRAQESPNPNDVNIVAQARLPEGAKLQVHTEPIRCVQQLGSPDVLKMSLYEAAATGGQELFIIGRNFNPKGTRVLFREYNRDGTLGWSADAKLDQRLLHQCHIVCTVPAYQCASRGALVSVTVICGPKQSHPINFMYNACEWDDDDWRPPDSCTGTSSGALLPALRHPSSSTTAPPGYRSYPLNHHLGYGSQNLRQKFGDKQMQQPAASGGGMVEMIYESNNEEGHGRTGNIFSQWN